jgi:uncharacterized protein
MTVNTIASHDRFSKMLLKALSSKRLFWFKKSIALFVVALIGTLALTAIWLAYTQSAYLLIVFFSILVAGFSLPLIVVLLALYPRRTHPRITPKDFGILNWQTISLFANDGVHLEAWFIPPDPASDGATLIYVHGLGGNRGDLLPQAVAMVEQGYGALLLDLRNHGTSHGSITTLGLREVEDVRGAMNYLLSRADVNPNKIGLVGYSMGGATVLRAAARIPQVRVVIAENAYSTLRENLANGIVVRSGLPPMLFASMILWLGERITGLRIDAIRPIDDIARLGSRGAMLIHGKQDAMVAVENSQRLYAAASGPKSLFIIENASHIGLFDADPVEFANRVGGFLECHLRHASNDADLVN